MYTHEELSNENIKDFYNQLTLQLKGLVEGEKDLIANLSNASALLFDQLKDINWAGFYLYKDNELVLGPFQGKPACIRISMGKGVCGTAAEQRRTLVVEDVHQFKGHIACDGASQSEVVVPIIKNSKLLGVLDIDSPIQSRFSNEEGTYLEELVQILVNQCQW